MWRRAPGVVRRGSGLRKLVRGVSLAPHEHMARIISARKQAVKCQCRRQNLRAYEQRANEVINEVWRLMRRSALAQQ